MPSTDKINDGRGELFVYYQGFENDLAEMSKFIRAHASKLLTLVVMERIVHEGQWAWKVVVANRATHDIVASKIINTTDPLFGAVDGVITNSVPESHWLHPYIGYEVKFSDERLILDGQIFINQGYEERGYISKT